VGSANVGAFVPCEAEPAEGVEDHLLGGGDEAGTVGVLDAEDEFAVALAGVDVVQQADIGGADVGVAGRGGGYANANGGFCAGASHHGGRTSMLAELGLGYGVGMDTWFLWLNRGTRFALCSNAHI